MNPPTINVMMDIETLGTADNALILSIGAVKFTAREVVDSFEIAITPDSAASAGLQIDTSAVMWWLGDAPTGAGPSARAALLDQERVHIAVALQSFVAWYGEASLPTWGNGAAFDNVILRSAFRALDVTPPWDFRDDRCYRTMKGIRGTPSMQRIGTHHSAVDDARSQAIHLQQIATHLGIAL